MFLGQGNPHLKGNFSAVEDGLSGKVSESERMFLEREMKESVERVRESEREREREIEKTMRL